MELAEYLRIIRRDWAVVVALTVLGCALGVALAIGTTPVYMASVRLFVATSTNNSPTDLAQGNTFTQDRVQSYTDLATSPTVTEPVVARLGLKLTSQQLAAKVSADAPQNKVLINLHVTDTDPATAATLANAVAAQFATAVEETEKTDTGGKPVVRLTVTHPATVPTTPIKPNKTADIGIGIALGLLVGFGIVVLREIIDNTVKSPQDFEELGVPVLGLVPFDKRTPKSPIAFRGDPHSGRSEAYRLLRTNLQFVNVDAKPRVLAVTSAIPGEGKTTTALNLAAALAEAGFRVCLIEADLRRPNLATTLGLAPDVGFTTAIIGQAAVEDVLQSGGRNLTVLVCGRVPPNPSELLITTQARSVVAKVADMFDYTIIDCAPLLPVADGAEVASLADATVLVHRAGKTTRDQALRSLDTLTKVGVSAVGVVLNMITRKRGNYDDAYGYYYAYRPVRGRQTVAARDPEEPEFVTLDAPSDANDDGVDQRDSLTDPPADEPAWLAGNRSTNGSGEPSRRSSSGSKVAHRRFGRR